MFERESLQIEGAAQAEGHSVYSIELRLAERAFAVAAGLPEEEPKLGREWLVELLDESYQRYGLSRGTNETREMVRAFESQAAEQTKQPPGRGR